MGALLHQYILNRLKKCPCTGSLPLGHNRLKGKGGVQAGRGAVMALESSASGEVDPEASLGEGALRRGWSQETGIKRGFAKSRKSRARKKIFAWQRWP